MFVNHISLTKDMYPSYIENSQNSIRKQMPVENREMYLNIHFMGEDILITNKYMKGYMKI